ncbi:hypothetical protein [Myceligenerans crystallogenes]|uniref:Histidine racemase CntK n=1 Tax=Myceligenerans crystallogenes TaxID=316335 RepID=A0ABN2N946_9MICO
MSGPGVVRDGTARERRHVAHAASSGTVTATARTATEVEFVKLSPTQNMTVLVTSRHGSGDYRAIAAQLLPAGHVHAEQVGFVEAPVSAGAHGRLHMAGDEFCGNASMALAALQAAGRGLVAGRRTQVVLEVSGAAELVTCRVERLADGYDCELTAPRPSGVVPYPVPGTPAGGAALVRYPDAAHLVVECDLPDAALPDLVLRDRAEELAVRLGAAEDVSVAGVMLYDPSRGELAPLVYVPALDSLVWERSCGSGTASVGAYLAARQGGEVRASVRQPGGVMRVRASQGPRGLTELTISGQVRVIAEGRAYVHV